ncbi:MAG: ABC transporter substrate-binding protein, partial [Thermotogota bacterium]|nr:ABC transporter substrate-binding protein [Thermotogota bacterium]
VSGQGIHQLLLDALWYADPQTGEWINALAAQEPVYNEDFTQITIKLREGIYWSDGVPFTADDVVFTVKNLSSYPGFTSSGQIQMYVKDIYKTDDYTVIIELKSPNPKAHLIFTSLVFDTIYIQPKHIWEDVENPLSFTFNPPVSLGQYVLDSYDPQGYWFLFKKREDWQRTSVGQLYGEPKPNYLLFIYYGTDDRKVAAQARHELDMIYDLTPEAFEVLRERNEYSVVWYEDFPWAWMDDVAAGGIFFNNAIYPFDNKDVRWALTLAINIEEFIISGSAGIGRVTALHSNPTQYFTEIYYKPLEPWLENFTLDDGYKPYDTNVAYRIAEWAEESYNIEVEDPEAVWGIGWWKYDPQEAEKLLLDNGFSKDRNGRWLLPDGTPWEINILAPGDFLMVLQRPAFVVADQWRKFGIQVNVETLEAGPLYTRIPLGDYEVLSFCCGILASSGIPDIWTFINGFKSDFYTPLGTAVTTPNDYRWKVPDRVDQIIDEMAALPPTDPKIVELGKEFYKIAVEEMPLIPTVINKKFNANDNYYWANYPTAENPYMAPVSWWGEFKFMLPRLEPTGRK